MLFNSYGFIFAFVPIVVAGFLILRSASLFRGAVAWLVACSLFFYAWWDPRFLPLLAGSILINYVFGVYLSRLSGTGAGRALLGCGVAINLLGLGVFKYTRFIAANLNDWFGAGLTVPAIVLPLAISFFTFQQIAYLVDAWKGHTRERNFLDYCLFVSFFPQLIAGPIVHHRDMLPQFRDALQKTPVPENLAVGISVFAFGLFKKVVFADGIAAYANPVFSAAAGGEPLGFWQAWGGALAYTLQLYFDFSGYSDMAIGLGKMFGVRLPINFHSPYKAASILDFWRRWHITLSAFLRDYLYIPLGGNQRGAVRRFLNLFLTMVLGGIWHGAGWTFLLWGALHGVYLVANHGWRQLRARIGLGEHVLGFPGRALAWTATFLAVVAGWVIFRADNIPAAARMLGSMMQAGGAAVSPAALMDNARQLAWTAGLLFIALALPNTQQIFAKFEPALVGQLERFSVPRVVAWRPNLPWAAAVACIFVVAVLHLSKVHEFLYFQF